MTSMERSLIRHVCRRGALPLLPRPQRRWARVHDVRFVATQQPSEKIYEKYKDKLDRKAKEIGVKDIDDLKRAYRETSQASSSSRAPPIPPPFTTPPPPQPSFSASHPPVAASDKPAAEAPPGVKPLSAFIDVPKFQGLPAKEIATLWRLRHAASPRSLCATIPYPVYQKIAATAQRHPQFILPLARGGSGAGDPAPGHAEGGSGGTAAEIHFLQWTFPTVDSATVLFTHLAEYKARGEFSVPHTTVTHHLELAAATGLVLLQGQVADDRGVDVEDARALLWTLQKFYAIERERPERGRLLEQFSRGDSAFRLESLVEEAEKIW